MSVHLQSQQLAVSCIVCYELQSNENDILCWYCSGRGAWFNICGLYVTDVTQVNTELKTRYGIWKRHNLLYVDELICQYAIILFTIIDVNVD